MRTLITGVTGFAGGHLAESLCGRPELEVHGVGRRAEWPPGLEHLADRVVLHRCDLADGPDLEALVREIRPGQIYHLAGCANPGLAAKRPERAWADNVSATWNLYEAVVRWGGRPRVLFVGSGLVYGRRSPDEGPPNEESPLRPATPYAITKAAADLLSLSGARFAGLDVVRARPFNHTGPRQPPGYVVPDFARQIAAVERKRQPPVVETGDLSACRDLTDVRDVVQAYVLLMERGRSGDAYNVASGRSLAVRCFLHGLVARAGVPVKVREGGDGGASDHVGGDATKLRRETGWAPRFTLEQTLGDTLEYWRRQP
jgi:GDP-4-dehydro-6-deoxy-D-mannose reductase